MKRIAGVLIFMFCMAIMYGTDFDFPNAGTSISSGLTASLKLQTQATLGIDLDRPYYYGLNTGISYFNLDVGLVPYQTIGNKVHSDEPEGFIMFNGLNIDAEVTGNNNPDDNIQTYVKAYAEQNNFSGWDQSGVYFWPIQTWDFVSGITYGSWMFQTVGGGEQYYEYVNQHTLVENSAAIIHSWAYIDSRVMYNHCDYLNNNDFYGNWNITPSSGVDSMVDPIVTWFPSSGLVSLGYNSDEYAIIGKIATEADWTAPAVTVNSNKPNGIMGEVDFSYTPDYLKGWKTIGSFSVEPFPNGDTNVLPINFGFRTTYDFSIPGIANITWEPFVGLDVLYQTIGSSTTKFAYAVSLGLTQVWPGDEGWIPDYIYQAQGKYQAGNMFPGLTVDWIMYQPASGAQVTNGAMMLPTNSFQSIVVSMYEPRDKGLIPNLGAELVAEAYGFMNSSPVTNEYDVCAEADYAIANPMGNGAFVPYGEVIYQAQSTNTNNSPFVNELNLILGVKLQNMVKNTTFGLEYDNPLCLPLQSQLTNGIPITSLRNDDQILKTYVEINL